MSIGHRASFDPFDKLRAGRLRTSRAWSKNKKTAYCSPLTAYQNKKLHPLSSRRHGALLTYRSLSNCFCNGEGYPGTVNLPLVLPTVKKAVLIGISTEVRDQRSEIGGQKSEDRGQNSDCARLPRLSEQSRDGGQGFRTDCRVA